MSTGPRGNKPVSSLRPINNFFNFIFDTILSNAI